MFKKIGSSLVPEAIGIRKRIYLTGDDDSAYNNEVTETIEGEKLEVHVGLQRLEPITCRPIELFATNLGCVAFYIDECSNGDIVFEAFRLP